MTVKPEDFAAAQKASIETFFAITNKAFESIVKLTDLNIATAKDALAQAAELSEKALSAKDAQAFVAIASGTAQPTAEKALVYSKKVYEISTSAQAELNKFVEAQVAHNNKQVAQWIDDASKNAPQGSETALAFVKSAVANANSAYDSLSKAAKQAVEMAEANVEKAVKATKAK
ncbi:phasin family protein [Hydromonas duriensis]|uniref:Phasin family protein n=1 Tax=Hydromonas duriensis TaxID=1527608 RepID=A0A4R6YC27_9BURK|nr:phasin family protein [Hydromonas duriensis]TDR33179.1 phasin family protein [Hydromonas duriensis]